MLVLPARKGKITIGIEAALFNAPAALNPSVPTKASLFPAMARLSNHESEGLTVSSTRFRISSFKMLASDMSSILPFSTAPVISSSTSLAILRMFSAPFMASARLAIP